jgi:hypothetical protein
LPTIKSRPTIAFPAPPFAKMYCVALFSVAAMNYVAFGKLDFAFKIDGRFIRDIDDKPPCIISPTEQVAIAFTPRQSMQAVAAFFGRRPIGRFDKSLVAPLKTAAIRLQIFIACAQREHDNLQNTGKR